MTPPSNNAWVTFYLFSLIIRIDQGNNHWALGGGLLYVVVVSTPLRGRLVICASCRTFLVLACSFGLLWNIYSLTVSVI